MQSVNPEEVEKFSKLAAEWWDPRGKFRPLHAIGPLRIGYIRDRIAAHFGRIADAPLADLNLLDIGCGGGLVAEPMARLGAHVTGIDASEKNIAVAALHAEQSGAAVNYRCTTAEALLETGARYDVVLALEIIEHVNSPADFVRACVSLVRPGGMLIFSTLNRTPRAYALAIVGAEMILRWLPRGTHDWSKFVRPSELAAWLREAGAEVVHMTGIKTHPLTFEWSLDERDLSVNYLLTAKI